MSTQKTLRQISGTEATTSARIEGYEMHLGISTGNATRRPMVRFADGTLDGAVSESGRVTGCHVHGLFNSSAYRSALLESLGARSSGVDHLASVNATLDEVASILDRTLNIEELIRIGTRAPANPPNASPAS
jgi:adenosylcobyric acid synthase